MHAFLDGLFGEDLHAKRVLSLATLGVVHAASLSVYAIGQALVEDGDLPEGVREALGEGPVVRGMRVTGSAGAEMAEPPKHHVMPQEERGVSGGTLRRAPAPPSAG